jgi:hypothetical protein
VIHPARKALELFSADHPGIWRLVDEARQWQKRHQIPTPPYVFLALGTARRVMRQWSDTQRTVYNSPTGIADNGWEPVSELKQFASWRPTQGIYRFDPTLYEALIATPMDGDIPVELIQRLPEWCIYIETPGLSAPLASGAHTPMFGVWATLERVDEAVEGVNERYHDIDVLHLGLHTERQIAVNHLPLHGTLESSIALLSKDWARQAGSPDGPTAPPVGYVDQAVALFAPILSLLLYLCAEASEIGDGSRRPGRPEPKRTRHGLRLFPADKPMVWDVGVRMGAALRRAYQTESASDGVATGRRMRPHVRRAHWHTFLAGRQREERRVKWLPPIPVNLNDAALLPATIRKVDASE